ncbi:MAG: HEAT repeat domain-containing protein [Planctomycetota bacterium]
MMILKILAMCFFVAPAVQAPSAATPEIIFADGRREPVQEPRLDSRGNWTALRDGKRTVLRAGEVVVVIDDTGKENVIIPNLSDAPDTPETTALLASLRDLKNPAWRQAVEQISMKPSKSVYNALLKLTLDTNKEVRLRGVTAIAGLRTKAGVLAATEAVFVEKDAGVRREMAYVLYSVQEIFKRSNTAKHVVIGLANNDPLVRLVFAMVSARDVSAAIPVLRNDGLKHTDHHVRESAAIELGRRGDGSGESILISMLSRTKLPGFDGGDELMEKFLIREQVEICSILGKFATEPAKAALKKAKTSKFEPVRKAAEAALGK